MTDLNREVAELGEFHEDGANANGPAEPEEPGAPGPPGGPPVPPEEGQPEPELRATKK